MQRSKHLFLSTVLGAGFLAFTGTSAFAVEPSLRWLGHAAFELTTRSGKVFLIDPWITNPKAPKNVEFKHVDGILITHAHFDHVGEAFDLATKFNAPLIACFELTEIAKKHGVKNVLPINASGSQTIGDLTVTAVEAVHSSGYKEGENIIYGGAPLGYILQEYGAPTVYDAGDTGVFSDMSLIAQEYQPHVVLLPIGGVFTMKPAEAALAARLLQAHTVIPMHFGTFPILTGTPEQLAMEMKQQGIGSRLVVMQPGQTMTLKDLSAAPH